MKGTKNRQYDGYWLSNQERDALYGLPHVVRLAYYEGIRPYLDIRTGLVGMMRSISYQSLREELFVEAHPGYKQTDVSKDAVRRIIKRLESVNLVEVKSTKTKLILYCPIAHQYLSERNKLASKSPSKIDNVNETQSSENTSDTSEQMNKPGKVNDAEVATPKECKENIVYLQRFEKFWQSYPQKKARQSAEDAFISLAPSDGLLERILSAIEQQKHERLMSKSQGKFVPNWKNPNNWLRHRCWEDEIDITVYREKKNEKASGNRRSKSGKEILNDMFEEYDKQFGEEGVIYTM